MKPREDCVPFDRVAKNFDRTRFIPLKVLRRAFSLVLNKLEFRDGMIVVDAGVGTGRIVRPLMQRKLTLIGVDISLPMLLQLKQKYFARKHSMKLHLIVADVVHLPIRSSSIDWVQSTHVLHLLKHWKRAVCDWQRVLRPKGALVMLQESGQGSAVRLAYDRVLRRKVNYRRRMVYSKLIRFLKQGNWAVRQSKIKWTEKAVLTATLHALENRSYSRQWNLNDEVHEKAMLSAHAVVRRLHGRGVKWETLQQELRILMATRTS